VQEYIEAPNLDQKRTYTTEQVRQIAQDLLEILIYLQSLTPPVLHRDIKPGNLLLDADGNLYLVDFGFSRIGLEDVAVSSMVRGTTGFMPPEQMLGLDLTKASDLYSVGATLICLILGIPSGRMAQLMDIGENRLKFSDRLSSDIDPHFIRWLHRMTEPRASDRFADAKSARAALGRLEVIESESRGRSIRATPEQQASMIATNRAFAKNLSGIKEIIAYDKAFREYNSIFRESSLPNIQSTSADLDGLNESGSQEPEQIPSRLELIGMAHTKRENAAKALSQSPNPFDRRLKLEYEEADLQYELLVNKRLRRELSTQIEPDEIALDPQILTLKNKLNQAEKRWKENPEDAVRQRTMMVAFHNLEAAVSYEKCGGKSAITFYSDNKKDDLENCREIIGRSIQGAFVFGTTLIVLMSVFHFMFAKSASVQPYDRGGCTPMSCK
jgi:serine/threonine protein kinase